MSDYSDSEDKAAKVSVDQFQASKQKTAEVEAKTEATTPDEHAEEIDVIEMEKADDKVQSADHETEEKPII